MNARTSYILVGLFVLGLGSTFVAGILWLGSGNAGKHYNTYVVYTTESVAGLSRDGVVKYRGVDVGRVREINLDPNNPERVRLLLEIEAGTPIKQDTVATLELRGLTGLAYVNLAGGSRHAPFLAARQEPPYPQIPSRPSVWGGLDKNFGALLGNLVDASQQLKTWLSADNLELLISTLHHLEKISGTLARQSDTLDQALVDLAGTLRNAHAASEQAPALIKELKNGAQAFERMSQAFEKSGIQLQQAIGGRDRDLQRFTANTLPEAAAMVTDLRRTAINLRQLSESLKRDPGLLLRGASPGPLGPGE